MKFRSPTSEPVPIGLTTGHTALITPEGVELDQMFHREAIAQGCLPESVTAEVAAPEQKAFDRALVIGEALEAMVAGQDADDFTAAGKPDLNRLAAKVGFKVSRDEADKVWDEVSKDADSQ